MIGWNSVLRIRIFKEEARCQKILKSTGTIGIFWDFLKEVTKVKEDSKELLFEKNSDVSIIISLTKEQN